MAQEGGTPNSEGSTRADPEEVLASFSRWFVMFDLIPLLVVAGGTTALLMAGLPSSGPDFELLVQRTLKLTPTSVAVWWFASVTVAVVAKPVFGLLFRLGQGDVSQAIVELLPATAEGKFVKNTALAGIGPLGKVRTEHFTKVALAGPGRTWDELSKSDPLAFQVVREQREDWEFNLRIALSVLVLAGISAVLIVFAGEFLWLALSTVLAAVGMSFYSRATISYAQFSRVFLAARELPANMN